MGYPKKSVNLLTIFLATLFIWVSPYQTKAQESEGNLYLVFEFMEVEGTQSSNYQEAEQFFKKIHQERVNSGEIIGWDLWSLQPGGEEQGFQYLTVTLFDDPVSMMEDQDWDSHLQKAYPDMSDEEINSKMTMVSESRDLAVRVYLEQIAHTEGDFEMKPGMVASIDLMKVDYTNWENYVNGEKEIFLPLHQEMVDSDQKGSWELLRFISPIGSDTYASHITVNMYEDWEQVFSGAGSNMEENMMQEMAIDNFLGLRDMKWVYWATLREMVR